MDEHPEVTALRRTILRLYVEERFAAAEPHEARLIAIVGDDDAESIIEDLSEQACDLEPDRSVEQFERCLADANQPAAAPATTAAPVDGLEAWERDALQRFENSHEPAFLDPITDRGSAAARDAADAALAAHRRNHQEVAA